MNTQALSPSFVSVIQLQMVSKGGMREQGAVAPLSPPSPLTPTATYIFQVKGTDLLYLYAVVSYTPLESNLDITNITTNVRYIPRVH